MQLLLTLLRILGILILAVILLVLLVVLLVLLVPIRYQVWARSEAENSLYAKVRIHWLLHLISLTAEYRDELTYRLKVLGITVFDEKKAKAGEEKAAGGDGQAEEEGQSGETKSVAVKSSNKEEKSESQTRTVNPEKTEEKSFEQENASLKSSGTEPEIQLKSSSQANSQSETDARRDSQTATTPQPEPTQKKSLREKLEDIWIKVMEFIISIPEKIASFLEKWADFQENIGERVDALLEKIDELNRKKDRLMRQLQDEQNQFAVKEIFRTLGKLLKHIRPQKLKVKGRLGFDDPAQTGQVFGIIGMLMPLYGEHIQLEAVFDEKIIEGELYLSGRIRIGTLLWLAIRLVARREVRRLIAQVRRLAEGSKASHTGTHKK